MIFLDDCLYRWWTVCFLIWFLRVPDRLIWRNYCSGEYFLVWYLYGWYSFFRVNLKQWECQKAWWVRSCIFDYSFKVFWKLFMRFIDIVQKVYLWRWGFSKRSAFWENNVIGLDWIGICLIWLRIQLFIFLFLRVMKLLLLSWRSVSVIGCGWLSRH